MIKIGLECFDGFWIEEKLIVENKKCIFLLIRSSKIKVLVVWNLKVDCLDLKFYFIIY